MNPLRIVTVTANPAVDLGTSVPALLPQEKLRCRPPEREPGGGGINCARVVSELGGDPQAVYAAGGGNGHLLGELLRAYDIEPTPVAVSGETRLSFHVHVDDEDSQYRFVLPGPTMTAGVHRDLIQAVTAAVEVESGGRYVIASGSLPPGCGDDFYAEVAEAVAAAGGRLVLDSSGPALAAAAEVGVAVLRNNLLEMEDLVERSLADGAAQERALAELVERGAATTVLMSLGGAGCLVAWDGGLRRLVAPPVEVASTVGAGDSLTAAFTVGLARGLPVPVAAAYGVAAGTAAVTTARTQLCLAPDVDRLFEQTLTLNGLDDIA